MLEHETQKGLRPRVPPEGKRRQDVDGTDIIAVFPQAKEEDPNCNGSEKPEPNDVTRTAATTDAQLQRRKRTAGAASDTVQVAANGHIRLAQADVYYGYCFDTGLDVYCYWYPSVDVIVTDTWTPSPY